MNKLFWIVLFVGVLFAFGCNEADDESATTSGDNTSAELGSSQPITTAPGEGRAPATDAAPVSEDEIIAMVAKLAPGHNLAFNDESQVLTGEGFPADGIPVSFVIGKVLEHTAEAGNSANDTEVAVNDILTQLTERAVRSSATAATDETADAEAIAEPNGDAASEAATAQEEATLIHPNGVYGDWVSAREVDGDRVIEHTKEGYYEYMQLHYKTKRAMFNLYKNRSVYNHQEYDFTYNSNTGELVLLGPADKVISTSVVWAYKCDHPIEIWVEKEGSRAMMVYSKKGRAGEPLSAYEIEERERLEREAWEEGAGLSRDQDRNK